MGSFRHGGLALRIRQPQILGRLFPKPLGDLERVDLEILPPGCFITGPVQLPMMTAASWHGEFVANFQTKGSGLCKAQMMRIGRLTSADETGLVQ